MKNKVTINDLVLDRSKLLDESIFIAICGLRQLRDGLNTTGKVRLEIAKNGIQRTINALNKKENNESFDG